jgi:glucans biosynthesis protein C
LCTFEFRQPFPQQRQIRVLYLFIYAVMLWSCVLSSLGLFLRFRARESRTWRYLSDSSYWLYIAHLPLVVALQVALAQWNAFWAVKLALVCGISIPLLLASYHYLVRPTAIGLVLNGRRYPFRWLPW